MISPEARAIALANRAAPKPIDLAELLKDCEFCARLTWWEQDFVDDLRGRMLLNKGKYTLSEKQIAALRCIEAKVYAVG
jgi:hypothetical protein